MNEKLKKLAVIGDPISHSLSPVMHNAAIKALKLNFKYEAVKVSPDELGKFISDAGNSFLGVNVTVPNKIEVIKYLDRISPEAEIAQSVNTVKFEQDGSKSGYSTDGFGLEKALESHLGIFPQNNSFLFVGCGGAAQAASAHLLFRGAQAVCFINRSIDKAEKFAAKLKKHFPNANISCFSYEQHLEIEAFLGRKPTVIQSTSLGLKESDPLLLPEIFFKPDLCYFDMIYRETKFLRTAKKYNCRAGNGLLMLLYQGAKSFEIWTGVKPPVEVMRAKLKEVISNNAN